MKLKPNMVLQCQTDFFLLLLAMLSSLIFYLHAFNAHAYHHPQHNALSSFIVLEFAVLFVLVLSWIVQDFFLAACYKNTDNLQADSYLNFKAH